ncbi:hypothetical protein JAAARDRAFT_36511 [Jaapia argillacea MUCL 33604]|uniref:Peptide hydrolase n=1 Tax=Jaapia argillacea MUCL 33604 TaxID=933084 RepID=A0A067PYH9_9AGAM|nr:hypothetical protein JAAARDRAFT_36511 [Jaapia argillacea MUCL 33604]
MTSRNLLKKFLAHRFVPTILVAASYIAIFAVVLVTDDPPPVPSDQGGLNLTQAWDDLHVITSHPHPVLSHANDHVRSYLLTRLNQIASANPSQIHIVDDLSLNASWAPFGPTHSHAVYAESTNILVKIDGSQVSGNEGEEERDAVLFSAHYDSVSTSYGATDNGMGLVATLQMIQYLAEAKRRGHGTKKTAVFNINNGEEDGLYGAHLFMEHPWSKICSTFLNVEGAGAGGRPLLFRTTSLSPTLSFTHTHHPHTNVISADAYARGVVRSSTDYKVYTGPNFWMQGLDFAFYKNRARYHTLQDDMRDVEGGRRALWAMMESVRDAGVGLLDAKEGRKAGAVYFDVLGRFLVVLPLSTMISLDVLLLLFGPISIVWFLYLINTKQSENGCTFRFNRRIWRGWMSELRFRECMRSLGVREVLRGLGLFWICLGLSAIGEAGLVLGYVLFNPFIIHSHPLLVITSSLSFSYLALIAPTYIINKFPSLKLKLTSIPMTMTASLLGLYTFTYVFLFIATVAEISLGVGGLYWVGLWNGGSLGGSLVGLGVQLRSGRGVVGSGEREAGETIHGDGDSVQGVDEGLHENGYGSEEEEEAMGEDEPLMSGHRERSLDKDRETSNNWWILQLLLSLPLPVLLISQLLVLLTGTLGQTLVDGSSSTFVYFAICFLSFLVTLPVLPFRPNLHRTLTYVTLGAFVVSTIYTWTSFPFTRDAPFKVLFRQKLEFDGEGGMREVTSLTGVGAYLERLVMSEIPSTWGKELRCGKEDEDGIVMCEWESGLLPNPGGPSFREGGLSSTTLDDWMEFSVTRLNETSATFRMKGLNTRACKIHFDNARIDYYHVHHGDGSPTSMQPGYEILPRGLRSLRVWSREWEQEFVVEVAWNDGRLGEGELLKGNVGCLWSEFENGGMPAFEEVVKFLPSWSLVTNLDDGLVKVEVPFVV